VGETLFLKPWYLSIIEIGFMDKQVIRRQYAAALCTTTSCSLFSFACIFLAGGADHVRAEPATPPS
ncbi:MAG: hypothetical protein SPL79_00060, partial [Sphaerochaetaceae bacterium]|nr:hypothetical protein [Sphaerochaetaceae bacterium]